MSSCLSRCMRGCHFIAISMYLYPWRKAQWILVKTTMLYTVTKPHCHSKTTCRQHSKMHRSIHGGDRAAHLSPMPASVLDAAAPLLLAAPGGGYSGGCGTFRLLTAPRTQRAWKCGCVPASMCCCGMSVKTWSASAWAVHVHI